MGDMRHRLARMLRRLASRIDPEPPEVCPIVIRYPGISPRSLADEIKWASARR